jgi:hypothetical protein
MRSGCHPQSSTFLRCDLDASAAAKRSTHWIGYKVHCSETCDEDLPRLITQVTTTIAPTPDRQALPEIHASLERRELLPEQHLVDAGYIDAEALVTSQTTRPGSISWGQAPKIIGGKRGKRTAMP